MDQKKELTTLVLAVLIAGALLGVGYWWFTRNSSLKPSDVLTNNPDSSKTFPLPQAVPAGTTITINGSTSMVGINQALKSAFEAQFPGTQIKTDAKGSDIGIQDLLAGNIDVAAVSHELTPAEVNQGLVSVPIAKDSIALVVGLENPFRRSLTQEQAKQIFLGKITNWSELGSKPGTIRVINRPAISGTHQAFKQLVLQGAEFGNTTNITTLPQDATTPLLRALKTDGIGYATYAQIANQQTVRMVPIDGLTPEAPNYPYRRQLYYVYKNPPSASVKAFLGFATSEKGQQAITNPNP